MQFKLAALSTLAVATLAAATPMKRSQCNTGEMHCCESVQAAGSNEASTLLGLLNVVVDDVKVLVGMNCSPLTAIGLGGNSWCVRPRLGRFC